MKLLFLTGNLPYPPTDGWKIRVFSLVRGLARRHEVTVVSFMRRIDDALAVEQLRDHGIAVHVLPRESRYSPVTLAQGLLGKTAFPILNYRDDRMTRLLRQVMQEDDFDLIQSESLHMAQYCLDLAHPTVLDLHNIESLLMKRYAKQEKNPMKRFYAEITWRKLATYEREVCGRFTHCLTCSDEERVLLQTRSRVERVSVIPNGVDIDAHSLESWPTHQTPQSGERIVFVGRMDYHANVEGVRWFCRSVWPRIRAARPGAVLQIVGGHPVPTISRLARAGEIEVTGFVTNVRPYLQEASVVVVPLRIGGGTRLKILEALAVGKAVISTTVGAEGIEAVPSRDLIIADRSDDFADHVVSLLAQPDVRRKLGEAGRRAVEVRYNWDTIVASLEDVYEQCLGVHGTPERNAQYVG